VEVLLHLVGHYDLDGLHLDRIRYPEFAVAGQTPATGTSIGYNPTSVARFQRRHGLPGGGPPPDPGDPAWSQWRRDQVTGLVRRVYLGALALKPALKVSAALIAFGAGPTSETAWPAAEAFWRVYQDWRAWTQEGVVDLAVPMNYKTEHTAAGQTAFDQWSQWAVQHQYDRAALIGQGAYLNAIEGTLRQTRRALALSPTGQRVQGVAFFSMANTNAAVASNPHSVPPGQATPRRPFAEFASGLVTGRSVDGSVSYEDPAANPTPVFAAPAAVPELAWKVDPQVGHLLGSVTDEAGQPVDAGDVTVSRVGDGPAPPVGRTSVTTATDGGGVYGGVDLAAGRYQVTATPLGQLPYTAPSTVQVTPGQVARLDIAIDRDAPTVSLSAHASGPLLAPVTVVGTVEDLGSGIAPGRLPGLGRARRPQAGARADRRPRRREARLDADDPVGGTAGAGPRRRLHGRGDRHRPCRQHPHRQHHRHGGAAATGADPAGPRTPSIPGVAKRRYIWVRCEGS
jgi:hypothetical protein